MAATQLRSLIGTIEKLSGGPGAQQGTDRQLLDDFSARRDESAFTELVARHGPLVLRVCRRVLHHEQDAEDAFQATFLVLARCSESIRRREALAHWLHGVAYRTAMNARRSTARRRNHEARLREQTSSSVGSPTWDDVQAVLDKEIQRLPSSFRSAFVLCVLEGKTIATAASELRCKEGTVSSRLTRARQRLQQQLARRGIQLAALSAALCVAESIGKAAVPRGLAQSAVRSGVLAASGTLAAGAIPSQVTALATVVIRAMFLQKAKIALLVLLTFGLLATGTGVLTHQVLAAMEQPLGSHLAEVGNPAPLAAKEPPKAPVAEEKPQAANDKDTIAYGGTVLGPDGKPVAGAKLFMSSAMGYLEHPYSSPVYATTGPDGRFQFTAPKAQFGDHWTVVAAMAPAYGAGWVQVPTGSKRSNLTLRLVDDDGPITGQIVDLEGKPVAGASLTVLQIMAAPGENLGPWLEAVKSKKGRTYELEQQYLKRYTIALAPKVTTDAEGRCRLIGIGRNRLVLAQVDGSTIAVQQIRILTRPGKPFEVITQEGQPVFGSPRRVAVYYGSDFRHAAAPTKPIVGVVRDKDTKKPLAGFTVKSHKMANSVIHGETWVQTTTDADGHYRLTGMPKGEGGQVMLVPPEDLPYLAARAEVPDSPGFDAVTVDFELKRGVWIEGKITDKATGKPLRGQVEYYSMYTNPHLRDYPGFSGSARDMVVAKEDGSYRVVGIPGPGLIGVYYQNDHHLRANVRDDEFGVKEDREHALNTAPYAIFFTSNFNALARIDAPKGGDSLKRDVTLDPGWTFTGKVLGPDGKPLTGVRGYGLRGWGWVSESDELKTAEFTVRGFDLKQPRDVILMHGDKGLIGMAKPPQEPGGSTTVQLERGAAVTGRLVDAEGKPRGGVELEVLFRTHGRQHWEDYLPERIQTDSKGRFHVKALLPGRDFCLSDDVGKFLFGDGLRLGQTKDLGDVRMKENDQ